MLSGKLSDSKKFKQWLAKRQNHFDEQNIPPKDVAELALKHGFSRSSVRQWQHSQEFKRMGVPHAK